MSEWARTGIPKDRSRKAQKQRNHESCDTARKRWCQVITAQLIARVITRITTWAKGVSGRTKKGLINPLSLLSCLIAKELHYLQYFLILINYVCNVKITQLELLNKTSFENIELRLETQNGEQHSRKYFEILQF